MKQYQKGQSIQISKNFRSKEFDCHGKGCCSMTQIDEKLVEYLQKIRNHFNKPVTITSAYRCEKHNKSVGGATKSQHMLGNAADIVVSGVASREVAKYAESIGILGIGLYETSKDGYFTHIDTRTAKKFWYGQSEEPRTTFGGTQSNSNNDDTEYHKTNSKYSIKLIYLYKGDKGRDVQIIQELLIIRGYNIQATGIFDQATYEAVLNFQKKNNLSPDGVIGSKTMLALLTA